MKNIIYILLISFLLVGCTTKTIVEPKIVHKDRIVLIAPPDNVLTKVVVPKPPDRDKFINSSNSNRMHMLSIYIIDLLNKIGTANNKIDGIRIWKEKQENIYNKK